MQKELHIIERVGEVVHLGPESSSRRMPKSTIHPTTAVTYPHLSQPPLNPGSLRYCAGLLMHSWEVEQGSHNEKNRKTLP
jgi:hypothetical protein